MGGKTDERNETNTKRWLIWPALILAGVGGLAALLLFTWPEDSPSRTRFDLGSVDAYSVGSVTTVEEGAFHLVRLSEETFIALSSRDSHLRKCDVNWESDLLWPPRSAGGSRGWFRAFCSGSVFDKVGQRTFGPSPRDLDRYVASIADDRVFVNTDRFVCGFSPPGAPCEPPEPNP